MPFFGHAHGVEALAFVAAGGIAGGLGQLFMTSSLRAPVAAVTPFDYLQIVLATVYGWLLFSDVPTRHTIIGATLIAGSGLYTAWREHRRRVRQAATPVPAV
jgi:drug/metabolite transporter (DMT)-like permease